MAKKNKPNRPQPSQPAANSSVKSPTPETTSGENSPKLNPATTRRVAIVLAVTVLVVLALILLALILSGTNGGDQTGTDQPDAEVSADAESDGEQTTDSSDNSSEDQSGESTQSDDAAQGASTTSDSGTTDDSSNDSTDAANANDNTAARSTYAYSAEVGGSVSRLSRRAMADFLADRGLQLNRAQRLFFEVTATNSHDPRWLAVGEGRTYTASELQAIYNQAIALTAGQQAAWDNAAVSVGYN